MIRSSFSDDWFVGHDTADRARDEGPITLPHDAMIAESRDPATPNGHNTGYYPGGVYRYTKRFFVPATWRDAHPTLEFEGVYRHSRVLVNGHLAGGRASGYALFHVPLMRHLRWGAENVVEVVAHNDDVPNSRWYTGSGIYRPVHLLLGAPIRIAPAGMRVTTLDATPARATLRAAIQVVNSATSEAAVTVTGRLSSEDTTTAAASVNTVLSGNSRRTVQIDLVVEKPQLWSPDAPHLYDFTATVAEADRKWDEAHEMAGIRVVTVDVAHGLRLNGTVMKLRGACVHHDNGPLGAVALDDAEDRRIRLLREAGFNAIRSAHNPASRALLAAADRHGMLVMEEFADVWMRHKTPHDDAGHFRVDHERDIEAMVSNAYNHPSVIMYSIGNEIAETGQPSGAELNRHLVDTIRRFDPTRPVTNGINPFLNLLAPTDEKYRQQAGASEKTPEGETGQTSKSLVTLLNFLMSTMQKVTPLIVRRKAADRKIRPAMDALDVAGYNYGGARYLRDVSRHPDKPIVGTETGPGELAKNWPVVLANPQIIGDFVWTGWDYLGEAGLATIRYNDRPRLFVPWPGRLAGAANIDITGHRQTQTYANEIIWGLRTDPYIAVRPVDRARDRATTSLFRATDAIRSWTWNGLEGTTATIEVYADAHHVELQLNGSPVRRGRRRHRFLTTFRVPYRPGALTAIAYDSHGIEIGRDELRTAGPELHLTARLEPHRFTADGKSLAYVPIELSDGAGTIKPLDDRPVTVQVDGPAQVTLGSAEPITAEDFRGLTHTTYQGCALAILRSTREAGPVTLTVSAPGCRSVILRLDAVIDELRRGQAESHFHSHS